VATTPLINVESQRVKETHTQKFFVVVSTTLGPPAKELQSGGRNGIRSRAEDDCKKIKIEKKKFAVNLRITKLAAATLKIPAKVATASFGLLWVCCKQASKPNI
jgi:hypothetical protein